MDDDELTEEELLLLDMDEAFRMDLAELDEGISPKGRPPFARKLTKQEVVERLLTMTPEQWQTDLERILLEEDPGERQKAMADYFDNYVMVQKIKFSLQTGVPLNPGDVVV